MTLAEADPAHAEVREPGSYLFLQRKAESRLILGDIEVLCVLLFVRQDHLGHFLRS